MKKIMFCLVLILFLAVRSYLDLLVDTDQRSLFANLTFWKLPYLYRKNHPVVVSL